jgi:multicomponent Na+:H+ antiporter subunit C
MIHLLIYSIGVLIFAGVYLMLSTRFWKVIIGTVFLSHGVNLVLLSSGGFGDQRTPPLLSTSGPYMDPLPQALILTAIVISFGVTAFILIVLRQVYQETGTTNLKTLEEQEWETEHETDD